MNGRSLEHFIPLLNLENLHRIMIQNTCNTMEINNRRIQLQAQQIPLRHDRVEVLLFLMILQPSNLWYEILMNFN